MRRCCWWERREKKNRTAMQHPAHLPIDSTKHNQQQSKGNTTTLHSSFLSSKSDSGTRLSLLPFLLLNIKTFNQELFFCTSLELFLFFNTFCFNPLIFAAGGKPSSSSPPPPQRLSNNFDQVWPVILLVDLNAKEKKNCW